MHRIFSRFVLLAALYVSAGCSATNVPVSAPQTPAVPAAPVFAPTPAAPSLPAPAAKPVAPAVTLAPNATPHIALLLPLQSAGLGHDAAEAVQQGFMAGVIGQANALPVRVYGCADESREIGALYQQAVANGAQAVVGALTRDGAMALAAQHTIAVPTLALYNIEGNVTDKLYFFGLDFESEARQIARIATNADLHGASIIRTESHLSKRLAQAFADEWKRGGGEIAAIKVFNNDPAIFSDLPVEPGNMVFIAATAAQARLFRTYLNAALPVYATSQIFNGNSNPLVNYDLRDVHFVDMPWLLKPDHPAVMVYARSNPPLETSLERFYALGIDASRLLHIVRNNLTQRALPLDGVTGSIRLNGHQFQREGLAAQFRQGLGLTPEGFAALNAAKAASSPAAAGTLNKQ